MFISPYLCVPNLYTFGAIFEKDNNLDINTINKLIHSIVLTISSNNNILTIHLDGWQNNSGIDTPCINYWDKNGAWNGWDHLNTYFGSIEHTRYHNNIVVPVQHWKDDPQIYPATVERKMKFTSSTEVLDTASWEKQMKAKKHEAMAKMLGFE